MKNRIKMREQVHKKCLSILDTRIQSLKLQLHDLVEGAKNDSKSTAGDKHETARAMMQIEQEKLANQLNLLLAQEQTLKRIDPNATSEIIANGSLVKTNRGWIYISVPLGKIEVEGETVMCLSAQSPLGTKLMGKRSGDSIAINNLSYTILSIE